MAEYKRKREAEKELADLNPKAIVESEGRPRRSRSNVDYSYKQVDAVFKKALAADKSEDSEEEAGEGDEGEKKDGDDGEKKTSKKTKESKESASEESEEGESESEEASGFEPESDDE